MPDPSPLTPSPGKFFAFHNSIIPLVSVQPCPLSSGCCRCHSPWSLASSTCSEGSPKSANAFKPRPEAPGSQPPPHIPLTSQYPLPCPPHACCHSQPLGTHRQGFSGPDVPLLARTHFLFHHLPHPNTFLTPSRKTRLWST